MVLSSKEMTCSLRPNEQKISYGRVPWQDQTSSIKHLVRSLHWSDLYEPSLNCLSWNTGRKLESSNRCNHGCLGLGNRFRDAYRNGNVTRVLFSPANEPSPTFGKMRSLNTTCEQGLYCAAIRSLEFMSRVMVHPEVPLNSNDAGLGPRR